MVLSLPTEIPTFPPYCSIGIPPYQEPIFYPDDAKEYENHDDSGKYNGSDVRCYLTTACMKHLKENFVDDNKKYNDDIEERKKQLAFLEQWYFVCCS